MTRPRAGLFGSLLRSFGGGAAAQPVQPTQASTAPAKASTPAARASGDATANTRWRRLHVGCGNQRLEGWLNVDFQVLPSVDLVADASKGFGLTGLEAVFAEHFLEHLRVADALAFLLDMQRSLRPGGAIRLSTPNLDWVWATHYGTGADSELKRNQAVMLNRAFYGWHHRFLWNRELLTQAMTACGFTALTWHRHGASEREVFRGLERHETYEDAAELPHVIIVEGLKGEVDPVLLAELRSTLERDFIAHCSSH